MSSKLLSRIDALREEGQINDLVAISLRAEFMDDILATNTVLHSMVSEWEAKMGDDDKTLYTLGLRRAIDEINTLIGRQREVV